MPLKRKFNLKNLGSWVPLKTKKKKHNHSQDGNKENVRPHAKWLENSTLTTQKTSQIAPENPLKPQSCPVSPQWFPQEPIPLIPAHQLYPPNQLLVSQTTDITPLDVATMDVGACEDDEEGSWDDDGPSTSHSDCQLIEDTNDKSDEPEKKKKGLFSFPPTLDEIEKAFTDLRNILRPRTESGHGFRDLGLDRIVAERLSAMKLFCYNYIDMQKGQLNSPQWQAASLQTAKSLGGSSYMAWSLRDWTRAFLANPDFIPEHNQKGRAGHSLIDDEDFIQELHLHLQSVGEYCTTEDITHYIGHPDILAKLNRMKTISHATAHQWMRKIGYRWTAHPHGQYADGHERPNVVEYRNKTFLPAVHKLKERMRKWGSDGQQEGTAINQECWVVLWYHDKSTFYAHDWQKKRWVHKSEMATPYAKGEGHSLMVVDFVSADYQ
jgi:hypothetical protein